MMRKLLIAALLIALPVVNTTAQQRKYVVDVQAHRGGMGLLPEESLEAMLNAVDLGVNTLEMDLCVTQDKKVILCAFGRSQIVQVKRLVKDVDPNAFIIVYDAHEILGEGFSAYTPGGL